MEYPVRIDLPGRRELAPRRLLAPADEGGSSQEQLGSRRILIVEDDHLVAMDIEAALLDAGFEVIGVVAWAEEAVDVAKSQKPDLVIMDIRLAGARDGVDAALELYHSEGIRSLFATAYHDSATRKRAQDARPLGWLAKPYQPSILVRAVQNALAELDEEQQLLD